MILHTWLQLIGESVTQDELTRTALPLRLSQGLAVEYYVERVSAQSRRGFKL